MNYQRDLLTLEKIERNFKALSTLAGQIYAATVSNTIIQKHGFTSIKTCILFLRSKIN